MEDAGKIFATVQTLPQPAGPGRPPSTTRHRLQAVAVEMFAAHGYHEVTIEALAAAAGISRRTFFRYFSSKADALMAGFDADIERLRSVLADSDPDLPVMDAIRQAVVAVNHYHADDLARLRQRMQLQHDNPALLANGILHYEEWQAAVAEFAAGRLGQAAGDLLPQVIARSVFGAAYAGFMSWLADERGDLSPRLDAALRAMADAFRAAAAPMSLRTAAFQPGGQVHQIETRSHTKMRVSPGAITRPAPRSP